MPTTKIVCRLFDADGAMLGWTQVEAAIRGDGMLRASSDVVVQVDTPGRLSAVSWHWADVNVETRVQLPGHYVSVGDRVAVAYYDAPLIVCGPMPGPLPAVTVRQPVAVGIPVGAIGASGHI